MLSPFSTVVAFRFLTIVNKMHAERTERHEHYIHLERGENKIRTRAFAPDESKFASYTHTRERMCAIHSADREKISIIKSNIRHPKHKAAAMKIIIHYILFTNREQMVYNNNSERTNVAGTRSETNGVTSEHVKCRLERLIAENISAASGALLLLPLQKEISSSELSEIHLDAIRTSFIDTPI